MRGMASKGIPIYPYAATPTTQPPRLKKSGGSKRKPKSTSRGHQLDPGTKHRSGGYIASSPSGPGATNPRGKKLEYKHEARKRKARDPGVRGSGSKNYIARKPSELPLEVAMARKASMVKMINQGLKTYKSMHKKTPHGKTGGMY